jgi:hypothetical protein
MKTTKLILLLSRVTYILGISFLIAGIVISYMTLPVLAQSGDEPSSPNEEATDDPSGEPSEESPSAPAEESSGELYVDPPGDPGGEPSSGPSEESPGDSGEESSSEIGEEPQGEPGGEPSGEPSEVSPLEGTQEPLPVETIEPTNVFVPEPSVEVENTLEALPDGDLSLMELMAASVGDEATSDDPDYDPTEYGLPDPGINGYLNDECDDPSYTCDKEEGTGVVNGGTYPYTPGVVVIKAGNTEFIYIPTGPECNSSLGGDPYCVEFLENQVVITRNECLELTPGNECRPAQEISNIQFWNETGATETPEVQTETPEVQTETPEVQTETPELRTETPVVSTLTPDPGTGTPENKKPTQTPGPDDTEEPATLETKAPPAAGGGQDLVPVTGADMGIRNPINVYLQKLFTYLGMMFLGMTFVLKGLNRIRD